MAKKKGGVSKTQKILDYKQQNPSAKPKAISEALSTSSDKISAQYVSTILSNSKKKSGKSSSVVVRRSKKKSARKSTAAASGGGDGVRVETLLKVKQMASDVGLDNLKAAISAYEKLTDA